MNNSNGSDRSSRGRSNPGERSEEMIRVDGRGQVLDMLKAADPEFRETILRGLEKRDMALAQELRRQLRSRL